MATEEAHSPSSPEDLGRKERGSELAPLPPVDADLLPPSSTIDLSEFWAARKESDDAIRASLDVPELQSRIAWSSDVAKKLETALEDSLAEFRAEWDAKEKVLTDLLTKTLGEDVK